MAPKGCDQGIDLVTAVVFVVENYELGEGRGAL
jgi:hypothetical protein